jgi:hypothetical protein
MITAVLEMRDPFYWMPLLVVRFIPVLSLAGSRLENGGAEKTWTSAVLCVFNGCPRFYYLDGEMGPGGAIVRPGVRSITCQEISKIVLGQE